MVHQAWDVRYFLAPGDIPIKLIEIPAGRELDDMDVVSGVEVHEGSLLQVGVQLGLMSSGGLCGRGQWEYWGGDNGSVIARTDLPRFLRPKLSATPAD